MRGFLLGQRSLLDFRKGVPIISGEWREVFSVATFTMHQIGGVISLVSPACQCLPGTEVTEAAAGIYITQQRGSAVT